MADRSEHKQQVSGSATAASARGGPDQRARRDHFLRLMFFQPSHEEPEGGHAQQPPEPLTGRYVPVRHFMARPGVRYRLPSAASTAPVQFDSPAIEVMTDLRRVSAITIGFDASIDAANHVMIDKGVRALFVVDHSGHLLGIVTATDTLGEAPVRIAHDRQIHRGDLVVRDIMTPADRLEVLDLHDVARARVGDIVATLQAAGRQHALAVEVAEDAAAGATIVRGIFSLTQIARQLGIPPGQTHDIARTFAEIERAIA